jgi:heparan-alpha-glucosaminide N-acetyltransferase
MHTTLTTPPLSAAKLDYEPTGLESGPSMLDATGRAVWLDAFRGFVMLMLVSRGFGFIELKTVGWAQPIRQQFDHPAWRGFSLYDMIQPWFMFIVGASMPFAFARRTAKGASWAGNLLHAVKRALLLLLCAQLVTQSPLGRTPELINVLAQIAFTYVIAFVLMGLPWQVQVAAAVALLAGHTAFYLYGSSMEYFSSNAAAAGPAWTTANNPGAWLDLKILGKTWSGNYATLNFVTSASATIAGVLAVQLVRTPRLTTERKVWTLLIVGVGLVGLGLAISPWVPIIKRIWTASFACLSVGLSLLTLLAFYGIHRAWPRVPWKLLLAVGANCIFLYMANMILGGQLRSFVNKTVFYRLAAWNPEWGNFASALGALAILVWVAWWLYNRRIFFKL